MANGSWRCAASVRDRTWMVAYHAVSAGHPDSAALQVLSAIMNGSGGGTRRTRWWWGGGRGGAADDPNEGRLTKFVVDPELAQSANMGFQGLHDPAWWKSPPRSPRINRPTPCATPSSKRLQDVIDNPPTRGRRGARAHAASAQPGKQPLEPAVDRHRGIE
jgi:hypothetical protein